MIEYYRNQSAAGGPANAAFRQSAINALPFAEMRANQTAEHIHQLRNRYRGALLGLACGDALGTTRIPPARYIQSSKFGSRALGVPPLKLVRSGSAIGREFGQRCRHDVCYLRTVGRRDVWNVGDSATMAGTSCDAKAYRTNGGSAVGAL